MLRVFARHIASNTWHPGVKTIDADVFDDTIWLRGLARQYGHAPEAWEAFVFNDDSDPRKALHAEPDPTPSPLPEPQLSQGELIKVRADLSARGV